MFGMLYYGKQLSYLWLTPLVQLFVAGLCFQSMVRIFLNPLNTALHKGVAYLTLILVDVLAVRAVFDQLEPDLARRVAAFCLIHLAASLSLTIAVTPWRESLWSWVWRFRGRRGRLLDSWIGSRTENSMALVTFSVIGVLGLGFLLIVPAGLAVGWEKVADGEAEWIGIAGLTVLLILTWGTVWQWCLLIMGRRGGGLFASLLTLTVVIPHMLGRYYQKDWLLAATPSAVYLNWVVPESPLAFGGRLPWIPLMAGYALLLVATWLDLHRRLGRAEKVVDHQLLEMGVLNA